MPFYLPVSENLTLTAKYMIFREKRITMETTDVNTTTEAVPAENAPAPEPKKKVKKKKFTKLNEISIIILSFAIAFTVFFFPPMDIFLGNMREFVVDFKHVALPMLGVSCAAAGALILVQNFFLLIAEWLYKVISKLLFGFLLAIYTQVLFLNGKMTTITGDSTSYSDDRKNVTINMFILTFILLLPLFFYIISLFNKKSKFLHFGNGMVLPYVAGLIFVMQLVGTGSSIAKADFKQYNRSYTQYLSYKPAQSLSKEGNVVVFLTDRLDSLWMDEVIDRYPDVSKNLQGFTFYQNNVSHNTNTFPSVPQMLTTYMYNGTEDWPTYTKYAWDEKTVPRRLTENGWNCNLIIDSLTTYGNITQLEEQCNNVITRSGAKVNFNYFQKKGIVQTMSQLSFARLSPYAFKDKLSTGLGSSLSAHFVSFEEDMDDMVPLAVDVDSDLKYYDYLINNHLKADSDKKTFSFIHLNCSHGTSAATTAMYDREASYDPDIYSTTRGGLQIVFEYLDQLRELGIYDNTTVIILGDHGRAPIEIEADNEPGLTSAITTGLLVKPANAPAEDLKLDRDSELSNDFFPASVMEYAGIDHSDLGYSYDDVVKGGLHPDRFMQTFLWGGYGKVTPKAFYKITGDARDFDNWKEVD